MTSLKAKTRLQAMLLSLRAIDIEVSYFGKIQFRTCLLTALNIGTSTCVYVNKNIFREHWSCTRSCYWLFLTLFCGVPFGCPWQWLCTWSHFDFAWLQYLPAPHMFQNKPINRYSTSLLPGSLLSSFLGLLCCRAQLFHGRQLRFHSWKVVCFFYT